jgi:hypothetical protein
MIKITRVYSVLTGMLLSNTGYLPNMLETPSLISTRTSLPKVFQVAGTTGIADRHSHWYVPL